MPNAGFYDKVAGAVQQVDNRTLYARYGGTASRNVIAFERVASGDNPTDPGTIKITECFGSETTVSAATIPVTHPATYHLFATTTGSKFYMSYGTPGATVSGWDEIT